MINFDDNINENKVVHNKNCPYTPDHPYRILIIEGSGSGKANVLLNLKEKQPDIDKIYLYAKDPYEEKYQYLINKREGVGINHLNDPKAFIEYSNDMRYVYKNIDNYNSDKENKILGVFVDTITDMIQTKKLNSIVAELLNYKIKYFSCFYYPIILQVPKDVRLNTIHFFISKLQQIVINHSSDISTEDFVNIYRKRTAEQYYFFVNHTTLASNNPLRFSIYNKNHDN